MKETIGYGIAGCGYSGEIHGDNLMKLPGARVAAVYDPEKERADRFALKYGAARADSLQELCRNPDVDALLVTAPNNSHVLPAVMGAEAGKHIFCEKPVALSFLDARKMLEAARKQNVFFFAAHTTNFIRGVQTAKRLVNEGAIGRILVIEAVHTDWAGPREKVGWKQKKEISGGHLYHHMHEAELICQLAGLPGSVYALGRNLAHFGPGFGDEEDAVMLLMEYPDMLASLTIGSAFYQGAHSVKIQGEKGGILLDFQNSSVELERKKEDGTLKQQCFSLHENEEEDQERRDGYRKNRTDAGQGFGRPGMKTSRWMQTIFDKELNCFHQMVRTGEIQPEFRPLADGEAALNCMKLLDGARASMETGKPVVLS